MEKTCESSVRHNRILIPGAPDARFDRLSPTVLVAQQVADEAAAVEAKDAYVRALQAFRSAGESAQSGRWSSCDETVAAARSRKKGRSSNAAENPATVDDFALVKQT
jgi:hypothetical protein